MSDELNFGSGGGGWLSDTANGSDNTYEEGSEVGSRNEISTETTETTTIEDSGNEYGDGSGNTYGDESGNTYGDQAEVNSRNDNSEDNDFLELNLLS